MTTPNAAVTAGQKKPATSCKDPKSGCCAAPPTQNPNIKVVVRARDNGCGAYRWRVGFHLPKPTCKGGWIVQEINFVVKQTPAAAHPIKFHYWEAWKVSPGGTTPDLQATYGYADEFSVRDPSPHAKGVANEVGHVKFYEGLTLPADFVPNNPRTVAGILHSTTKKPSFWDGSGTLHQLVDTWDCTSGAKPATITTVPK